MHHLSIYDEVYVCNYAVAFFFSKKCLLIIDKYFNELNNLEISN